MSKCDWNKSHIERTGFYVGYSVMGYPGGDAMSVNWEFVEANSKEECLKKIRQKEYPDYVHLFHIKPVIEQKYLLHTRGRG